MPANCPALLPPPAVHLWKSFRSKTNAIPPTTKVFAFPTEWRSSSDRNAVRNHNGIVFAFRPESRSPSTGFPMQNQIKPDFVKSFWESRFLGQVPSQLALPEILEGNTLY